MNPMCDKKETLKKKKRERERDGQRPAFYLIKNSCKN